LEFGNTDTAATTFGLSLGRIGQIRKELKLAWERFVGNELGAAVVVSWWAAQAINSQPKYAVAPLRSALPQSFVQFAESPQIIQHGRHCLHSSVVHPDVGNVAVGEQRELYLRPQLELRRRAIPHVSRQNKA
jgi:hypothetical protein